jgi:hypothetical protein
MGFLIAGFLVMLGAIAAVHAAPFIFGALAIAFHGLGILIICALIVGGVCLAKRRRAGR